MAGCGWHRGWWQTLRRLWRDQRGAVLIYGTVVLAAIFGMGGLAIDGGRLMSLHSDMQSYADHVALAAAGELDGGIAEPNAIQRAEAAAFFVADAQKFATGGAGGLEPAGLRFLHSLPASDDDPITAAYVTTDPAEAAYVEVTVGPLQTDNILMAGLALAGIAPDMQGEAMVTAVAGGPNAERGRFFCDITPFMFCPPSGMDREDLRDWLPGRQIRLRDSGPGWGPGAFGLLNANFDPNGPCGTPNQGKNFLRCALAVERSITRCFSRRSVCITPGQGTGPVNAGLNVRMDMYTHNLGSLTNNPDFSPAPNVIKGFADPSGCLKVNPTASNVAPLPIEPCLVGGANNGAVCPEPSPRFSPSQTVDPAQRAAYVQQNYTSAEAPDKTGGATTRYGMYMNEIAASGTDPILNSPPLEETGLATCSLHPSNDPERRVLIAAAADCRGLSSGGQCGVPVFDFYRIFITNIAGEPDEQDVWVEVINLIDPAGGGDDALGSPIHDFVQLYR